MYLYIFKAQNKKIWLSEPQKIFCFIILVTIRLIYISKMYYYQFFMKIKKLGKNILFLLYVPSSSFYYTWAS